MPELLSDAILFERFESKYIPEPMSGCWLWEGKVRGPGRVSAGGHGEMWNGLRLEGAHRLAYRLLKGPIPDGMQILHKCDVRYCVNPDHLFVGTQSDNIQDCANKGRHPATKLTDEQVIEIRLAPKTHGSNIALAKRYGVNKRTIYLIRANRARTHVI